MEVLDECKHVNKKWGIHSHKAAAILTASPRIQRMCSKLNHTKSTDPRKWKQCIYRKRCIKALANIGIFPEISLGISMKNGAKIGHVTNSNCHRDQILVIFIRNWSRDQFQLSSRPIFRNFLPKIGHATNFNCHQIIWVLYHHPVVIGSNGIEPSWYSLS